MSEPMSAERLAEIYDRAIRDNEQTLVLDSPMARSLTQARDDRDDVIAEVWRLRAVLAAKEERETALLAVVRAVAGGGDSEDFTQRSRYQLNYRVYANAETRAQARAALSAAEASANYDDAVDHDVCGDCGEVADHDLDICDCCSEMICSVCIERHRAALAAAEAD